MSDVRLSAKNQISVPKDAREALGLKAGDTVRFMVFGDRVELVKPRPAAELAGLLHRPGQRTVSIDEMNEAGPADWEDETDA